MQTKFSPGPWHFESQRGTKQEHCFWGVYPQTEEFQYRGDVCSVSDAAHIGGITEDEALANARLIAAAPELFEMAQEVVRVLEGNSPAITDTVWVTGGRPETLLDMARAALAKAIGEPQ